MTLLSSQHPRTYAMHGVTFTSYASTLSGAKELAGWCADFPPGTAGMPHSMSHEELLFILSGRLRIQIDQDVFEAHAGDTVLVPAGATFTLNNNSDAPASAWVVTAIGMTATLTKDGTQLAPAWAQ